jgi:hypothetical protein
MSSNLRPTKKKKKTTQNKKPLTQKISGAGTVAYIYIPSTWEVEANSSQPGLHGKTLS